MSLAADLHAAAGRDEAAAARLFDAVNPGLQRWLRATEPAAAEDLAAETWVGVAHGMARFEGDSDEAVLGWIFGIARRRVADHRRRGARRTARQAEVETALAPPEPADPATMATNQLAAEAAIATIRATCSEAQADAIILRVIGGLDVDAVAAALDRSPGAVRVLIHRGLHLLRATLAAQVTP